MATSSPVAVLSRDRTTVLNNLLKNRLYWTTVLQGYTDPVYLRKAITRLRAINSRVDALGARSRPVRGIAVTGEVT